MARLFTHGFTTKKTGHGFGLHASFIATREMGGKLSAESIRSRYSESRPGGTGKDPGRDSFRHGCGPVLFGCQPGFATEPLSGSMSVGKGHTVEAFSSGDPIQRHSNSVPSGFCKYRRGHGSPGLQVQALEQGVGSVRVG